MLLEKTVRGVTTAKDSIIRYITCVEAEDAQRRNYATWSFYNNLEINELIVQYTVG